MPVVGLKNRLGITMNVISPTSVRSLFFFPIFERADMNNSNISFFLVLLGGGSAINRSVKLHLFNHGPQAI